jgi:hypothetical protein
VSTGPMNSDEHNRLSTAPRIVESAVALGFDPDVLLEALANKLDSLREGRPGSRLTQQQKDFLLESGDFTTEELARTEQEVNDGILEREAARDWLLRILDTIGISEVSCLLGTDEVSLRADVEQMRLCAVQIAGELRFPRWQFDASAPEKLLPHLEEVLHAAAGRWDWQILGAFMSTSQSTLISRARQTPIQWLSGGGSVASVVEIVESSDWN